MKSLLRFGIGATGGGLVSYFAANWDDWLVGRRLGTEALGFYSKAYDFTHRLVNGLSLNVVGSVFFASYTRIREDEARLRRAYVKSVQLVSMIMFPISMGILATAPLLVSVVLGEKWIPMIPTLMIYTVMILTRPVSANTSSLYKAVGRPSYDIQAGLVLIGFMLPLVLLLIPYGIEGVAVAVVIADFAGLVFNLLRTRTILPDTVWPTIRASLLALGASLAMFVVVFLLREPVIEAIGNDLLSLVILVAVGVVVYGSVAFLTQRTLFLEILQLGMDAIGRRGKLPRRRAREKTV
jgi:O-antigen/teichoic acid export membrane protein